MGRACMVNARHYERPPIVEAVIDLKFDAPLSEKLLGRLRDRFKRDFPTVEEKRNIHVAVHPNKATTSSTLAGFKMTAQNAADLVLINVDSFGSERLAPYERWEALRAAAERNFEMFTKVAGRQSIVRIGVRYINRIDIPSADIQGRPLVEFVKVGVSVPEAVTEVITDYSIFVAGNEPTTGAKMSIRCGFVPSPLIERVSVALDIDVYWDYDIPGRIEEVWNKTEILRNAKNIVFENCITDQTRALFQ